MTKPAKQYPSPKNTRIKNGFALPIVIGAGLVLTLGAMLLMSRTFSSLINSTRRSHATDAKSIAENGMAIIIQKLNNDYSYLLIENCEVTNNTSNSLQSAPQCPGWTKKTTEDTSENAGTWEQRDTLCPGLVTPPDTVFNDVFGNDPGGKGRYRMMDYEFIGDRYQGGIGVIRVQGQRLTGSGGNETISASAIIQKELTIVPKYCDLPPFAPEPPKANFALLANTISLGVGDVLDLDQDSPPEVSAANVHCIDCFHDPPINEDDIWQGVQNNSNSVIDGERSSGPMEIPDPPSWNSSAWGNLALWNIVSSGNNTIEIRHNQNTNHCFTETLSTGGLRTHCRIGRINLSGNSEIVLFPDNGDFRFYMEGTGQIALSGNGIYGTTALGQFAIYGLPTTQNSTCTEQIAISGNATLHAFIHMPNACVTLNGGGSGAIELVGSVIAKSWVGNGNFADLRVPENAAEILEEEYGYSVGGNNVREFAALGTNRWNYVQLEG